jgi:predicted nucleic acid-binding protein
VTKRTYLDTGVLLAAFQSSSTLHEQAMQILDDPERELLLSDAVWLETVPKAIYEKREKEVNFYNEIFKSASCSGWNIEILQSARKLATQYGLAAMDAIHMAHALASNADEFVTGEKEGKPLFRVEEIAVRTIQRHH